MKTNELLTILGHLLIELVFLAYYLIICGFLFKLCRKRFNDGDYTMAWVFVSILVILVGAGIGFIGSVI